MAHISSRESWTGRVAHPHAAAALIAFMLVVLIARVVAIFTENVTWDETALLQRAVLTSRTGEVMGGGRPGLGTLVLLPFAAECRNAIDALVQARVLWTLMVVASAAAFWVLLRGVLRPSPHRWISLATGLGLWVLVPPFLRYSTQVRTDQGAILFGLVGGVALMASRRTMPWAVAAGVLFGIGFLFTQKLVYVAALAVALAGAQLVVRGGWNIRRDVLRVLVTSIAFLAVVVVYRQLAPTGHGGPAILPLGGGLRVFEHYREVVGWRFYLQAAPLLIPQFLAIGVLLLLTLDRMRNRRPLDREIAVGWCIVGLGIAVAGFHAGRFPYFLMVLGLSPAVIGAMVTAQEMDRLTDPVRRAGFLAILWVPMVLLGGWQVGRILVDQQRHQRQSLDFVERNFPPEALGFNSRAAFACRQDPEPFPVLFNQQVLRAFGGEDAGERAENLMEEFRRRPVAFMIPPRHDEPYPPELRRFWQTRYVRYSGSVHVPGREVRGAAGWTDTFEVIVPGDYIWRPAGQARPSLEVDGRAVDAGATIRLDAPGHHRLVLGDGGSGIFVLVLPEDPAPDPRPFFRGF